MDEVRRQAKYKKPAKSPSDSQQSRPGKSHNPKESSKVKKKFKCGRCGSKHTSGQCPAFGKSCDKCHLPNHFAKCCRTQRVDTLRYSDSDSSDHSDDADHSDVGPLFFDSVTIHEIQNKEPTRDWICNVEINGKAVSMKLDTGSQANIISVNQFKRVTTNSERYQASPS